MKKTKILMGMPITVEVSGTTATETIFDKVFSYFSHVDEKFSTFKRSSEISLINRGEIKGSAYSREMAEVFALAERTKNETNGYFNIKKPDGSYDPSGLVKGWSVNNAAQILRNEGLEDFYIEAGGDIQVSGKNSEGESWSIGIRNPFNDKEIIKLLKLRGGGIATSGTYARGNHIYNPNAPGQTDFGIVSLTVIGPDVYEADRFATAAFAMGEAGINFIEKLPGFEGYIIDKEGIATYTSHFNDYVSEKA